MLCISQRYVYRLHIMCLWGNAFVPAPLLLCNVRKTVQEDPNNAGVLAAARSIFPANLAYPLSFFPLFFLVGWLVNPRGYFYHHPFGSSRRQGLLSPCQLPSSSQLIFFICQCIESKTCLRHLKRLVFWLALLNSKRVLLLLDITWQRPYFPWF